MQEQPKPVFYVKAATSRYVCDCGKGDVTSQILTPPGYKLLRCEDCLKKLKYTFQEAEFVTVKALSRKLQKISNTAKNDKKQSKFSQNTTILKPSSFIQTKQLDLMQEVSCVFCLYTTKLQKFFKTDAKGRTIALVECPECHNKMRLKTLLTDMTPQEYAKFVYGYRLSGFWQKCPFALFNKRLRAMGISNEFWSEYKKLKGENTEQPTTNEENKQWEDYKNEG